MGDRLNIRCGYWENCALSMRVPNCSPVVDKDSAPTGPEILSSTGTGVWRKASKAFPGSSSVLDKFQSAKIRSRPGKSNQRKGPNEKFINFAHFSVNSGVFPRDNKHDSHWTFVPECPCEKFMNWPFFGLVCLGHSWQNYLKLYFFGFE